MTRGTTPIITFNFSADYSGSDEIQLTFSQNGHPVLVFTKDDITCSSTSTTTGDGDDAVTTTTYTMQVTLTQEQANLLDVRSMAEVQFRFVNDGAVTCSTIAKLTVNRILNDEVL